MPELPEVQALAERLDEALGGRAAASLKAMGPRHAIRSPEPPEDRREDLWVGDMALALEHTSLLGRVVATASPAGPQRYGPLLLMTSVGWRILARRSVGGGP